MENKYLKLRLKYLNDYDFINYLKSLKTKTIKSIYKDYLLEIERLEDIYLNKREGRSKDYKEYKDEKRFIVYFNSYLLTPKSTQTNTVKSVRKFSNIQR
ncbi:MAG TPA: hypothetical protein GXX62_10185 [Alcaligenaceae bacterium]|nr:hypothetical protein [Alcaligenaceae bacterium]